MGILLVLLVILAPTLVMTGMPEPHLTPKVLALLLLLDAGMLGIVFSRWRRQTVAFAQLGTGRVGIVLSAALMSWLLAVAVASFRGEYLMWGSLLRANGWWIWLHAVGVVTVLVLHTSEAWRIKILRVVAGMGTMSALIGWVGKISPGLPWIGATGSMVSTIGNASFLAGYLLVTLGATGVMYARTAPARRGWWIAAAIVQVSALVATDSRAGLLGLVCGCVAAGVWALVHMPRPRAKMAGALLGGLIVAFAAVQFAPASWHLPRGLQISAAAITSQTRLLQWQSAWSAMVQQPFGWGRGAYPEVFAAKFDPASIVQLRSEAFNDDAHNTLLMVGVETGFLGVALWCVLYGALLVALWRVSPWAVAMGSAYGVYLLFTPEQPVVAALFWIAAVSMVAVSRPTPPSVRREKPPVATRVALACLGIAVIGSMYGTATHASAFAEFGAAEQSRMSGRWFPWLAFVEDIGKREVPAACQFWEKTMQTWISSTETSSMSPDIRVRAARQLEQLADVCTEDQQRFYRTYLLAQYYARQAVENGNEWIARAQDTFAQAQTLSPRHPYPGYAEGQFLIEINRVADAIVRLERVRAQAPEVRETYVYLYLAYRIAGDEKRAGEMRTEGLKRGALFPEV